MNERGMRDNRQLPSLTVAIATHGERLLRLSADAFAVQQGVKYHIFVQGHIDAAHLQTHIRQRLQRHDIILSLVPGIGAARSRNAALAQASHELVLFADDDLIFHCDSYTALRARFAAEPSLDIVCGRVLGADGQARKAYGSAGRRITRANCAKVGTPEIALRLAPLRAKNLRFDETFGAGTRRWLGDEYIFLCDCLKNGLKGRHLDLAFATHCAQSSGFAQGQEALMIRRQALMRALGKWAGPARLGFALKHWRSFSELPTFLRFILP
jgi:hypothetical protein